MADKTYLENLLDINTFSKTRQEIPSVPSWSRKNKTLWHARFFPAIRCLDTIFRDKYSPNES